MYKFPLLGLLKNAYLVQVDLQSFWRLIKNKISSNYHLISYMNFFSLEIVILSLVKRWMFLTSPPFILRKMCPFTKKEKITFITAETTNKHNFCKSGLKSKFWNLFPHQVRTLCCLCVRKYTFILKVLGLNLFGK